MIIDLPRFVDAERPCWNELEQTLKRMEKDAGYKLDLAQIQRLHYLHRRACAGLARLSQFGADREIRRYLESLVSLAYGEIHEEREKPRRFSFFKWFFITFPQTFRRHISCFHLACMITLAGVLLGAFAISLDPEAKDIVMPFSHLQQDPSERVRQEEQAPGSDSRHPSRASFSSFLITHNIKISILDMALGMTWGVGTIILVFYNGVILGAVCADYVLAGQSTFLLGWLLPHGAVEIPAFLLSGQTGFVLARAIIGRHQRASLSVRMRQVASDVITLVAGVALFLVWAGFVESYLSQHHEPVIPYPAKIFFGAIELLLLSLFLALSGRNDGKAIEEFSIPSPTSPRS
ncbi:MAG: stage II sporulation protein M [Verrucomicrobiae bacterium]|nr:stage II sporulation protein M [Verrucomicrobiae bacterium]